MIYNPSLFHKLPRCYQFYPRRRGRVSSLREAGGEFVLDVFGGDGAFVDGGAVAGVEGVR